MKEQIKETMGGYFISVALINLAMFATGMIFRPEEKFGYEAFIYPWIYGTVALIPTLIMRTKKELSVKQMIIRKCVHMLLTVAVIIAVIFGGSVPDTQTIFAATGVAISIVIVFVTVQVIQWILDDKTAKRLTEDLAEFKKRGRDTEM